eukprot:6202709-Pleurochrysis_carterae.AAC.3
MLVRSIFSRGLAAAAGRVSKSEGPGRRLLTRCALSLALSLAAAAVRGWCRASGLDYMLLALARACSLSARRLLWLRRDTEAAWDQS